MRRRIDRYGPAEAGSSDGRVNVRTSPVEMASVPPEFPAFSVSVRLDDVVDHPHRLSRSGRSDRPRPLTTPGCHASRQTQGTPHRHDQLAENDPSQ